MDYLCKPHGRSDEDFARLFTSRGVLKPGDTVWLAGGTYNLQVPSIITRPDLQGAPGAPITFRNVKNERVDIIGGLGLAGDYLRLQGLWITGDCENGVAVMRGDGHELINNSIWRVSRWPMGCGVQTGGTCGPLLLYGNLVFQNGRRHNQHGLYLRNYDRTKPITVIDNILWENASFNMSLYCETHDIEGYHVEGNISFAPYGGHLIVQGKSEARYVTVRDNFFMCPKGTRQPRWPTKIVPSLTPDTPPCEIDVRGNYCIGSYDVALKVCNFDKGGYPLTDWAHAHGPNTVISRQEAHQEIVYVRKNRYLPRYHVAIVNPTGRKISIPVDFQVGSQYRVRNVLGMETQTVYPDNGVVGADRRVTIEQNYDKHNFKSSMGRFDYEPEFGCYIVEIDES